MKNQFFQKETIDNLNEGLAKSAVMSRQGVGQTKLQYVASHHVINEANRLFGFGMWGTEIQHLHMVDKSIYVKPNSNPAKEMVSMSYICRLKLTVRNGTDSVSHEDTGFGNGVAGNTAHGIGSVIELASKEAVTDALKRCLRYYGNKFGLSLYDKQDDSIMEDSELENSKLVTPELLAKLRELYEPRGINDEWVMAALKAEHYPLDSLEMMRFDWYQLAMQITKAYKLDEVEAASYEADINKVIELLKKSATMSMVKSLYLEAYNKAKNMDDKQRMLEIVKIKDELKAKFEGKK